MQQKYIDLLEKLEVYFNTENNQNKITEVTYKSVSKMGKILESMEKDIAILKKDSHPQKEWLCLECGCKAKPKKSK